ncbi:E3 ubiquitin-protein ligase TRIM47-like isoform X2 [Sparus aurata]|uniref:E3 ubiquitin/ISG15 ligase TRIM25-like n=1 Tax=Sparus aurata TaxID=8175 RepID=A0A671TY13_SPAAU|nr:E3 ubiquitin-protein ligase TRIM47-like isoform X2 [Sparus aurata]
MEDSQERLSCPICLNLLNDPVTTACGHTFCMICINAEWDTGRGRRFGCPLCRQTFSSRPVLKRNTLLADLIEEHKKKNRESAAAGDRYAEPGDVQCDVCTGRRKRKASMFCLVCLASYCETHLKPHYEVVPLKKHKLMKASAQIRDKICGRHYKHLEIYCRTDQQFICPLCLMGEHKGHDTVEVAEKKYEIQRQLERTKEEIANRVLQMERLRKAARSLRAAASEARGDFKRLCEEHKHSVERKTYKMREKVGEAEKAGVDWTDHQLGRLQREKIDLRQRGHQIDQLTLTEDPIQLFQGFQALDHLPAFNDSHESFDTVTEFVTEQKKKLKNMCDREKNVLFSHSGNLLSDIPRLREEIPSRTYLLTKYKNFRVEVDPNTVSAYLCLSDRNRQISWSAVEQAHPDHPDRFSFHHQALCKMGLERSCYWEVEWDVGVVDLAVSYKGIKRKGSDNDCSFGHNKLSWKLTCSPSGCTFWHNNLHKGQIPPVQSRRAGVFLDYEAGTLRFFSVSDGDGFDLLHQVQTTFTEPLYPGFSVDLGTTLKICDI